MGEEIPAEGFLKNKAHYLPIRIYYADTDFSGFVHHSRYVEFMERGRTEALRAVGINQKSPDPAEEASEPILFTVSEINLVYRAPAYIDDSLLLETAPAKITAARLFMRQRIFRDDRLLMEGECCLVLITPQGRPRRIPDKWRSLLT